MTAVVQVCVFPERTNILGYCPTRWAVMKPPWLPPNANRLSASTGQSSLSVTVRTASTTSWMSCVPHRPGREFKASSPYPNDPR